MVDSHRRSALENYTVDVPGVKELRCQAIIQINGAPDDLQKRIHPWNFKGKPQALKGIAAKDTRLLWSAPGQYLLVSESNSSADVCEILEAQLRDSDVSLVDLSQARTVFEITGPHVRELLAKGCPLDVDAMQAGDCAPTLLAHFNVLLYCRAPQTFQVYVFRSFGLACMEWLADASREFQD